MRNILTIAILTLSINVFAQKVEKEFYGYTNHLKYEYQVDNATGAKNGYYKSYTNLYTIYESGFFKMGKKSGTWTIYDENGTGQISAIMNYSDGKQNGSYKQWCWKGANRYLCAEYMYKDDREISSIKYFSNGKKSVQNDLNGYFTWFEDGTSKSETKNGKIYTYEIVGNDSWGKSKEIERVKYDSLGFEYGYLYGYNAAAELDQISMYVIDIATRGEKIKYNFKCGKSGELEGNDSTVLRIGYKLLKEDPNPVSKKYIKLIYDEQTGNITIKNNDNQILIHYCNPKSLVNYTKKIIDENNNVISEDTYLRNGTQKSIEYEYTNGKLAKQVHWNYQNSMNRNQEMIKTYYENGVVKSDIDYLKNYKKEFYPSGKLALEHGCKIGLNICCYYREYYESGNLKMEIPLLKTSNQQFIDSIYLDNHKFYYNEIGGLIKIEELNNNNTIVNILSTNQEIGSYIIKNLELEFNSSFSRQIITGKDERGFSIYAMEYPKGINLYFKTVVVLEKIKKSFIKSETDEERNKLVLEYKSTIKRVNEIENSKDIEEKLGKVKKVEEIKIILGI